MIKFGCCLPGGSFMPEGVGEIDRSTYAVLTAGCAALRDMGYDYAEAGVGMIMNLTDEQVRCAIDTESIRIYAANSFMPGNMRIASLDERLEDYVSRAMSRLSSLGARYLVFGSGSSRRYTDDEGREQGRDNVKAFLRLCDRYADINSLTMALEPLNARETNMVTTISEGAEIVRELNAEGCGHIKLLADTFHMSREPFTGGCTAVAEGTYNENAIHAVSDNIDIIVHAHAAEPFDRRYPGSHDGDYAAKFIRALKASGYNGGVSVECGFGNFLSEAKAAIEFLKRILMED